jgi:curved DNA-binding protein CbpA
MKDYYQILEIMPSASQDAIKEQYRFLVQAWHPDKFPNPAQKLKAEEKLKEINEAYATLRNPAKRADYDSRVFYTRSSHQQEYREQTSQRQSEAAHRAKESQGQKEHVNREPGEAEKRRAEEIRKQRMSQLTQEIALKNQEIIKLNKELPKMPTSIFAISFFLGGLFMLQFALTENGGLFFFAGGVSIIIGIILFNKRSKFFKENYKPKLYEIEKQKRHLQQLVREKHYLK